MAPSTKRKSGMQQPFDQKEPEGYDSCYTYVNDLAEGDSTASRKRKSSKHGTRKSYNGPDRSGYALDGGVIDSRNISRKHMKGPFQGAKREVSQKSDSLLQLITQAELENKPTSPKLFQHSIRPHTLHAVRPSSLVRDGQDIRDSMRTTLGSLKNIADVYRAVNVRPSQLMEPCWMRWGKDETELRALNQTTRDLSLLLVDCFISPKNCSLPVNSVIFGEEDDIAKLSWEIMEKVMPKKGDQSWGSCANEFFKALADIVKQCSSGAK